MLYTRTPIGMWLLLCRRRSPTMWQASCFRTSGMLQELLALKQLYACFYPEPFWHVDTCRQRVSVVAK